MDISIRRFQEDDIPYKVKWINDDANNKYLHYDLPLNEDKTITWFRTLSGRMDRADYTILCDGEPAGLIGIINMDTTNKKAEYYICLGGDKFKGKGIASIASDLLIRECHHVFNLQKVYLYTEVANTSAQHLFERIGFVQEGLLKNDVFYQGNKVDRFAYGLDVEEYMRKK